MLHGLRLWENLIGRHHQDGGIHHRRAIEHGREEGVMPWAVDEGEMPLEPHGAGRAGVGFALTRGVWAWAYRVRRGGGVEAATVGALPELEVGVPELDGAIAFHLCAALASGDPRKPPNEGALAMGDMPDDPDIDCSLFRRRAIEMSKCRSLFLVPRSGRGGVGSLQLFWVEIEL